MTVLCTQSNDNNSYGFICITFHMQTQNLLFINTRWLKEIALEMELKVQYYKLRKLQFTVQN